VTSAVHHGPPAEGLWIANTDADSRAALDWIAEPVRLADEGADALHSPVVVTTTTLRVKIQPPDAREMRRRIRS
jgi:hypothetical protein